MARHGEPACAQQGPDWEGSEPGGGAQQPGHRPQRVSLFDTPATAECGALSGSSSFQCKRALGTPSPAPRTCACSCARLYRGVAPIDPALAICAGFTTGAKVLPCHGDSGGGPGQTRRPAAALRASGADATRTGFTRAAGKRAGARVGGGDAAHAELNQASAGRLASRRAST